MDHGFRVVIAPSLADIFHNNCFKNGLLPIILEEEIIERMFAAVDATHGYQITVDLPAQQIHLHDGEVLTFAIDPFRKDCHIRGLDDIGLTMEHAGEIRNYEEKHRRETPWLFDNQD
jgi:3-isopropylmalate/(R)-2-methylmalate dehydratase small subunit